GETFERCANLIGLNDILKTEFTHIIALVGRVDEKPFSSERLEGGADRRARDVETFGEVDLDHPFAGSKVPGKDRAPQRFCNGYTSSSRFRFSCRGVFHLFPALYPTLRTTISQGF